MPKVKVNHSGYCEGYTYEKGVAVNLPKDVLAALGEDSYEVVDGSSKDEETKQLDKAPQDKQVKNAVVNK